MHYEISGANARLVGTVHKFPPSSNGLPAWFDSAYRWSSRVFVESTQNPALLRPFLLNPPGVSLRALLPGDVWASTDAALRAAGSEASVFDGMKPWAAFLAMGSVFMGATTPGAEEWIRARALVHGKPVRELESPGEISEVLGAIPMEDVSKLLASEITKRASAPGILRALHEAWFVCDEQRVTDAVRESPLFTAPAIREALFARRNAMWVPRIEQAMGGAPTLFAVGALHLMGGSSLVEMLRQRGHTLVRLP